MGLLLQIDTSNTAAAIYLTQDGHILAMENNAVPNMQATWIHKAIEALMQATNYSLQQIDAVSVSNGPGSYTGLRIGLSTAKGICYAMGKPLITISTLEIMVYSLRHITHGYICPMIDARRQEVYMALYKANNREQMLPMQAHILSDQSLKEYLDEDIVFMVGDGSNKADEIITHSNKKIVSMPVLQSSFTALSYKYFEAGSFADLFYAEPFYCKPFYSTIQ